MIFLTMYLASNVIVCLTALFTVITSKLQSSFKVETRINFWQGFVKPTLVYHDTLYQPSANIMIKWYRPTMFSQRPSWILLQIVHISRILIRMHTNGRKPHANTRDIRQHIFYVSVQNDCMHRNSEKKKLISWLSQNGLKPKHIKHMTWNCIPYKVSLRSMNHI